MTASTRTPGGPATAHAAFASSTCSLTEILSKRQLTPHFQVVYDMMRSRVYGHESLIRGPDDTLLRTPDALFSEARRQGLQPQLELASAHAAVQAFAAQEGTGHLFINMSATAIVHHWLQWRDEMPARLFGATGLDPERIVLELTETDPVVPHLPVLTEAFAMLRAYGVRIALDDYGVGHSSLQLWSEVRPDLVKIDRYFFHGIATDDRRQKMVRAVLAVAQCFSTAVIAEGIETAEDLACVRDMGIRYAQGWMLGRPNAEIQPNILDAAAHTLATRTIGHPTDRAGTAASLRLDAPVLRPDHTNDDVHKLFDEHKSLHAVAIVDDANCPVGIINRRDFSERYAQRYTRELFGRNPCSTFMNTAPVLVELSVSIDQLSHVLISEDQRYLMDGFVITRDGCYDGLGTGEALVRSVTEMRIEAARYANPLTSLPGNIPISQHIAALVEQGSDFVTCYGDLNNFKPFNDVFGYWRGDDMILLCAEVIRGHCDPQRDFVGHVGGDDFVVLFRSPDWHDRALRIIAEFNTRAIALYDDAGRSNGGIEAEDRYGVPRFFPFVTIGIGALLVRPAACGRLRPEDIASAAAHVKHKVKHGNLSLVTEPYVDLALLT